MEKKFKHELRRENIMPNECLLFDKTVTLGKTISVVLTEKRVRLAEIAFDTC